MQALRVVLLQSDPGVSQSLADSLRGSFHSVQTVPSADELRLSVAKHRAEVVIVDMEMVSVSEVKRLCHEYPAVCIVCTHRLADEEMWTEALSAGAADVCPSSDTRAILTAAIRNAALARSIAA